MAKDKKHDLQVIICSGVKDIDRTELGLSIALNSTMQGQSVVIFFTAGGAEFIGKNIGSSNQKKNPESIEFYIKNLLDLNAVLEVCSSCLEKCDLLSTDGNINTENLIDKRIKIGGVASVSARLKSTKTIIF